MRPADSSNKSWRRRDVIKLLGATAITGPALLRGSTANAATSRVIKIGHVSPQSGALAPFAEADSFILSQIRAGALVLLLKFDTRISPGCTTPPLGNPVGTNANTAGIQIAIRRDGRCLSRKIW